VSRSLSRLQALLLGAVVLAGLLLAGAGLYAIGSRGWFGKDALNVQVGFREVRGVEVGTRVRIQGIDAGEVTAVEPPRQSGGPVILHLRLHGDYRQLVRTTSRVQIQSEGLIGGKVVEIQPGHPISPGEADQPVAEGAMLQSAPSTELGDLMTQAGQTLEALQKGQGSLGKLANEPQAHDTLVAALQQIKETAGSIQQTADAMQRLPIVRGYVENPVVLLERPNCNRDRRWFAESDLFEPGEAILTAQGKARLDEIAPWLEGMKHKGSEVVVAAYADQANNASAEVALNCTRKQSEAVSQYLKSHHAIQKMTMFSSRNVIPLGRGLGAPPSWEREKLPPARVEVIVFLAVQ
jgi:phospholipid/cholesterol/gamma-HCH transport system substrate-binding protein